jgi:ribonuclease-3
MLSELEQKIGYTFKDKTHLKRAITHKSCGPDNNERQEFLGDRILALCVADMLYKAKLNVEKMATAIANLVSHKALLAIAKDIGLEKHLRIVESGSPHFKKERALADAVEALSTAIRDDGGSLDDATRFFFERIHLIPIEPNYKSLLQEYIQALGLCRLKYDGAPIADGIFEASVKSEGLAQKGIGHGNTLKEAEKDAAKDLLKKLNRQIPRWSVPVPANAIHSKEQTCHPTHTQPQKNNPTSQT